VVSLLPVWLAVSVLAFGLGNLAPGDPAEAIYYQTFGVPPTDQFELDQLREELGLDDPLSLRYGRWLINALRGNLGVSYRTGLPVWPELTQRLWVTLQLALGGLLVTGSIAFPLGILAAVRHNSRIDMLARIFSLAGASLPSYWLAYMFILLFAVYLNWLPVAGSGSFRHLVLPCLTLGMGGAALLSRLLRSAMLECLSDDYIGVARAKGLPESRVVLVHALRNAMIPVVTVLGNLLGLLLSGAIIVETVFSWPGLGRLIVDSIQFRDYPVIQGFVLLTGSFFVLINLMVDLSYTRIDPRVNLVKARVW
jgi:peptide/nickel transport system permease protein